MKTCATLAMALAVAATAGFGSVASAGDGGRSQTSPGDNRDQWRSDESVQLGPRPFYLVEGMDDSELKDRLMECRDGQFYRTDFSIGHRGAALQFPECVLVHGGCCGRSQA